MKVRHKEIQQGFYAVVASFLRVGEPWYVLEQDGDGSASGALFLAAAKFYEPIPTEQWRDCTGECVCEHGLNSFDVVVTTLRHKDHVIFNENGEHYRLRKVELYQQNPLCHGSTGHSGACYEPVAAFFIERKVSHD